MTKQWKVIHNCEKIKIDNIPLCSEEDFIKNLDLLLSQKHRVCAYFAYREDSDTYHLYAICTDDSNSLIKILRCINKTGHIVSLTEKHPQLNLFEREIFEQTGIIPDGHPWLKPVRYPFPSSKESEPYIGKCDFFTIEGEEIHQVAVGPVHAGIIEPGHFRFNCHGENVFHLEISLGYQHRGIEENLVGGPYPLTPFQIETIAGDTTIGHSIAYCQIIESLTGTKVSYYDSILRAIALELERCANHTGDLGALAGDVGFLPTMSYCGRIRGDFLNLTALLCGNRFGRGFIIPGGIGFEINDEICKELLSRIELIFSDFMNATELLWKTPSVVARFEGTGRIDQKDAELLGIVGVASRAAGCKRDIRIDHPFGYYRFSSIPISILDSGDVFARAHVRWQEVQNSVEFIIQNISELLKSTSKKEQTLPNSDITPNSVVVSLVEGWRGEICHVAITDSKGRFKKYKIVDPSFHNWFALSLAMRNQQISDFPLCNKSFNLSYCGYDL